MTKILTVETSGVAPSLMTGLCALVAAGADAASARVFSHCPWAGLELGCPVIYCRSGKRPITMDSFLTTESVSHTVHTSWFGAVPDLRLLDLLLLQKGGSVSLFVSQEYLSAGDKVLVVDDFLGKANLHSYNSHSSLTFVNEASGTTIRALINLIDQANATLVGIGALVEKTFEVSCSLLRRSVPPSYLLFFSRVGANLYLR